MREIKTQFAEPKEAVEFVPHILDLKKVLVPTDFSVDSGELTILIEIDGGINDETIEEAAAAGVDCFVAGSAVYRADDPAEAVEALRQQAAAASPRET